MDHFGVVGLSWKQGGSRAVARYTVAVQERVERLASLAKEIGADELVYLATCCRVELFFVAKPGASVSDVRRAIFEAFSDRPPRPGEAERALQAWAGEGAAEHLFLVTAGLDSARVGESEIAGQVREAHAEARALGIAGPELDHLFETALKVSRRIRKETGLGGGRTSLAEIALDPLRERGVGPGHTVALIGVSPMTERCGRSLVALGATVLVVNRTLSRARALADELGDLARARGLGELREAPEAVSAVICATSAEEPVLDAATLERLARRCGERLPLLIDFANSPDVDPEAARTLGFERLALEEILERAEAGRRRRLLETAEARAWIDEALEGARRQIARRSVDAVAAALQQSYQDAAREALARTLRRELRDLDGGQRERLERFVDFLARRFAYLPTTGLRAIAYQGGPEALHAFLGGAGNRLARASSEVLR